MREDINRAPEEGGVKKSHYTPNRVKIGRLVEIINEFRKGFKLIQKYSLAVTIFGSSRESLSSKRYEEATHLATILSRDGFTIITGGGGGIMGAANKGAKEAGGNSLGLNIKLLTQEHPNKHTTESEEFKYFFVRKVMLAFASEAYIFFPGGFGTLDELFEIVTLIKTKKIQKIPVVLVGKEYWTPLLNWMRTELAEKRGTIDPQDLEIMRLVDSVEEAHKAVHTLLHKLCPECIPPEHEGKEKECETDGV